MDVRVSLSISGSVPPLFEDLKGTLEGAWERFLREHRSLIPHQVEGVEVSLSFVEPEAMREVNLKYRQVDSSTDVLSFPLWEEDGRFSPPVGWRWLPLGDLLVCVQDVEPLGEGDRARGVLLVIHHGFLHLLGFDHGDEEQRREMWLLQDELMSFTV